MFHISISLALPHPRTDAHLHTHTLTESISPSPICTCVVLVRVLTTYSWKWQMARPQHPPTLSWHDASRVSQCKRRAHTSCFWFVMRMKKKNLEFATKNLRSTRVHTLSRFQALRTCTLHSRIAHVHKTLATSWRLVRAQSMTTSEDSATMCEVGNPAWLACQTVACRCQTCTWAVFVLCVTTPLRPTVFPAC